MKRFLTIEFEEKQHSLLTDIVEGDCIAFISLQGHLKCGVVVDIVYEKMIIKEFRVNCKGKIFIADTDRILKNNHKVTEARAKIIEETTYTF